MSSLDLRFLPLLEERSRNNLLRVPFPLETLPQPLHLRAKGRDVVNFSSNDYLGLTHHPRIIAAAQKAAEKYGTGAGASSLITGQTDLHRQAIHALTQWEKVEDARLLPSGYQTAHAIVQTLCALPDIRFLIDKLTHASLIDAVRASGAQFRVFPHNSTIKLARLLDEAPQKQTQVVIAESIYSMDGDEAPLKEMADLKKQKPFIWVLDEAHGTGVYGSQGAGLASEKGVAVDIKMITFSKALGLAGGAILSSKVFCQAVDNFGRAYIYSTAISPMIAGALIEAISVLQNEPWRTARVRELATKVRKALGLKGDSPIVPIFLSPNTPPCTQYVAPAAPAGEIQSAEASDPTSPCTQRGDTDESQALEAARNLLEAGYLVSAIRPPTVPRGTSRLRLTLSSAHSDEETNGIIAALKKGS